MFFRLDHCARHISSSPPPSAGENGNAMIVLFAAPSVPVLEFDDRESMDLSFFTF